MKAIEDAALGMASIYRAVGLPLPDQLSNAGEGVLGKFQDLLAQYMPFTLVIDEETVSRHLYGNLPDPDLVIRTSGELRLSNFLLWQIAYSEIYVTEKLWPDFAGSDLLHGIADYQRRERRYGGLSVESNGSGEISALRAACSTEDEIAGVLAGRK